MPSNASRRHDTIYSQVQYFGCHLIKYKELAANRTRVYPMILGIKRKTTLWFSSGCGVSDCGVTVTDPGDFFFEGDGMVVQEQRASKQGGRVCPRVAQDVVVMKQTKKGRCAYVSDCALVE
jgi:hypothetical protein